MIPQVTMINMMMNQIVRKMKMKRVIMKAMTKKNMIKITRI